MMGQSQDYYSILQISADATPEEIKTAFRRLARQYHPDLNQHNPEATAQFQQISQAYEVLSDPQKRHRYYLEDYIPRVSQNQQKSPDKAVNRQPLFTFNRRAQKFYHQGLKKCQQQQYQKALAKYNQAIELNPQFIEAYLQRCEIYFTLGNHRGILEDCERIIKLNPALVKAFYYQGRARHLLGLLPGAIDSYSKVIRQDDHHAYAYYYRGIAYRDSQDNGSALPDFHRAGDLFVAQGNQPAFLLVKENISSLTPANSPLDEIVGSCFTVLQTSWKTAAHVVKELTK